MHTTEELIGSTLDEKYRIDRLVGRGGMGAVFLGTHVALDRPVAIKVLKPEFLSDEAAMARFVREARTAARVEHPNAVSVYDFGAIEGGGAYLVMEFVEGRTLRELMREHGRFPLEVAADFAGQAAAAVAAAHAKGVIHRDLKPENMIVRADEDGRLTLKVVDFGIAKLLARDGATQVTGPSELVGTPKYMAPEQFSCAELDERVDVYALGVLLYELLAGRCPFEGTVTEVIGKHLYSAPSGLAATGLDVPEDVERAIMRALEKSPAARTRSAAAFAAEVAEACGVPARPSALLPATRLIGAPAASYRGDERTSTIGSLLPPTGVVSRRSAEEFITRYNLTRGGDDDAPTRVRNCAIPTVVVPAALARAAAAGTAALGRGRRTVAGLSWPLPAAGRRWLAPAAVGLAGLLLLGTGDWDESGGTPHETAPVQSTAAAAPVPTAPIPPIRPTLGARPDGETVLSYGPGTRRRAAAAEPADERARRTQRTSAASQRVERASDRGARTSDGGPGRMFERVFRIDRQLKKLF